MDRDFLIQLTNNLYKLTLLFPKKEPLRYKIREIADDILTNPTEKDFEVLNNFFEVAKQQNWVKPADVLAIQKEYDTLRRGLDEGRKKESPVGEDGPQHFLPERQEKILSFLKENGRVQVGQLVQVFPEVTKRTLRRDFEHMLQSGLIERMGERNDTFYQVKIEKV